MASQSPAERGTGSVEHVERYEVIDGVRVEQEPMGVRCCPVFGYLLHDCTQP